MRDEKLRILVISAHYPPDHSGGYGLRIKDIVDGLSVRGHHCRVLSTRINTKIEFKLDPGSHQVLRRLHNRYNAKFFPKEVLFDLVDTKFLEKQIQEFRPDVIYLGHIYVLSKALLPYLASIDIPLVLDEGGASLKGAWEDHGRWFYFTGDYGHQNALIRMIKPLVIKIINTLSRGRVLKEWRWPENMRMIINSQHNLDRLREMGIPMENATVIHSGIDLETFTFHPREVLSGPISILCPGRLEERKGMLDAVHLLKHLLNAGIDSRLSFAGAVGSEEFVQKLKEEIYHAGLQGKVSFHGMLSQKELVDQYHSSDICFFPSYQEMGFSRTPLEAMACGCVVISYGNEGSDEVIRHGDNGYIVRSGDYDCMAKIIKEGICNLSSYQSISTIARKTIEEKYDLNKYITNVEKMLL